MDELTKTIIESDYANLSALVGSIELDHPGELLGKLNQLLPAEKRIAIKKLTQSQPYVHIGTASSRAEMESKFMQLPKDIRVGLLKKRLQLVDTRFYLVKSIANKNTIDMVQGTDQKGIGLGNLANQKLEKDNWFITSAIRMLYGVAPTRELADFGLIPPFIRNGEFELEAGTKTLFGPTDTDIFNTDGMTNVQKGFYKVENTKIIEPQVEIKMPVKFTGPAPADSWLRVTFTGTSVIPF